MIFNMNGGGEQKLKKSTGDIYVEKKEDYYIMNDGTNPEDHIDLWTLVITLPDGLKYYEVKASNLSIYMRYYIPIGSFNGEEAEAAFLIMYDPETEIYTLVDPKSGDVYGTSDFSPHTWYDESTFVIACDPNLISPNLDLAIYSSIIKAGTVYY